LPDGEASDGSDVQDGPTDLLPAEVAAADAVDEAGDDASDRVRARIEALIVAARDLSDTCADLADGLRPLPGAGVDDPLTMDFGRLRAERTAALLDEAASAARGTLGLLDAAYGALEQRTELAPAPPSAPGATVLPPPRSEVSTWPDAFVELPPRSFPAEGTEAVPLRRHAGPDASMDDRGLPDEADAGGEPVRIAAALAGWVVVDPDDETDTGTPMLPESDGEPAAERGTSLRSGPAPDGHDRSDPAGVADGDREAGVPAASRGADAAAPAWGGPDAQPATHAADEPGSDGTAADREPAQPARGGPAPGEDEPTPEPAASAWDDQGADQVGADQEPAASAWGGSSEDEPADEPAQPAWDGAGEDEAARQPTAARGGPDVDESGPGRADQEPAASAWRGSSEDEAAQQPAQPAWGGSAEDEAEAAGEAGDGRAVAAQHAQPAMLTLPADLDLDDAGRHGDTVSPEPRSLTLVPPLSAIPPTPTPTPTPTRAEPDIDDAPRPAPDLVSLEDEIPEQASAAAADVRPWTAEPTGWDTHRSPSGLDPAAPPVWTAEAVPGASVAGDGLAVYPLDTPGQHAATGAVTPLGQAAPGHPVEYDAAPLDDPGAAVISRQVEAARRHLQAALVVAHQPAAAPRLGTLLTAVERVLTAVTDLARETRGVLEQGLADRTFPGEARFLCAAPWETASVVGPDSYGDDVASPAGLAKLLRALGYEAQSVTSASGVARVQVRSERYAAHVALVEPAGGGRQRWSGALEWVDPDGTSRTWAETLGPVELAEEELARRVDELLRRCVGPTLTTRM